MKLSGVSEGDGGGVEGTSIHEEYGEAEAALGSSCWPCCWALCVVFKLHGGAKIRRECEVLRGITLGQEKDVALLHWCPAPKNRIIKGA